MSDTEKHASGSTVTMDSDGPIAIDPTTERSLVRKQDLILMPGLALAYLTHTLDRANLGNAKTDTLEKDLHLVGNQFSLLLILFYVPYGLMNVPFTLLSKRFNPAVVIPSVMSIWGIMAMASAGTKNFGGILACRILMGCVESAFLPCAIFYCSLFYTRRELSFRVSIFGMMGFIAGAISGLIAFSVFQWHRALNGWQYLFIIEGALTVGIGLLLFLILPHSVQKSRWFSEEEKCVSIARLAQDSQDEDKNFHREDAKVQLRDKITWVYFLMALFYGVGVASSSNFLPTMVKRLAKVPSKSNLYTVGPNLVAAAVQLSTTFLSDHFQQRATIACGTLFVSFLAWILLATLDLVHNVKVGYFLTYLITFGTFTPGILVPVWLSSNTTTTTGRALRLGISFMGQNLAGIISSVAFRAQDAPTYKPALVTVASCQAAFIVVCLSLREYYRRENKKLESGEVVHFSGGKERPEYRYAL
ncbi:MFS general substrate transporter [Mytilinidion resinicola]|uniref:MFS general substrate transporter n=1 Tax=Mytilinidion resinicola TaxID=574789 RepID=A0A6A6YS40_9PEZI|nr:MFS general substrate transporter [Mytilinidion resinicola]KAF2811329.1 MFS general substrate transporter [Mytilinidion resinicola]